MASGRGTVLVWVPKKQSLRQGFLKKGFIGGVSSGERKHEKQKRVKKYVKQGCGSSGFGVVPQGALGHKSYYSVDPFFSQGATLYPSSVIGLSWKVGSA